MCMLLDIHLQGMHSILIYRKNNISDLSGQDSVLHIRGNVLHRKKKSGYWKYIFLMLCGLHIAVRKN